MTDVPETPERPASPPPPKRLPYQLFGGIAVAALAGVAGAISGNAVLILFAPTALIVGFIGLLISHHRARDQHDANN